MRFQSQSLRASELGAQAIKADGMRTFSFRTDLAVADGVGK